MLNLKAIGGRIKKYRKLKGCTQAQLAEIIDISTFYTKHTFHFIYVNQVIHIVILVDNVDNFVYNLIISGFADFCHVENFLESFSLIHHDSTGFVHFARIVFFNPIMPAIARSQADILKPYAY